MGQARGHAPQPRSCLTFVLGVSGGLEDEDCCSPTPTFLSSYPPPPTPNLPPAPLSPPRSSSSGWPPSLSVCVSSFAYIRSLSSGHFCDSLFPEWRSPTPDGRMVIRTFPTLLPLPPIPTRPHTHVLAAPCRMRKVRPLLLSSSPPPPTLPLSTLSPSIPSPGGIRRS